MNLIEALCSYKEIYTLYLITKQEIDFSNPLQSNQNMIFSKYKYIHINSNKFSYFDKTTSMMKQQINDQHL